MWGCNGNPPRLEYSYANAQWLTTSWYSSGAWYALSAANTPAEFFGDGGWHDLNNGWLYRFSVDTDSGIWTIPSDYFSQTPQFRYLYSTGQWEYAPRTWPSWSLVQPSWLLSGPNLPALFIGDGAQHDLNNGWLFAYQSDTLEFYRNVSGAPLRFSLNGLTGQWSHYDGINGIEMPDFGTTTIDVWSTSGGLTWLWDDRVHAIWLIGWMNPSFMEFTYDYANDELRFCNDQGLVVPFLKYSYVTHRWYDRLAMITGTDASWRLIPTDGIGAEIVRTYWAGGSYSIGKGKQISISSYLHDPVEYVTDAAQPGYTWAYHYTDGTWILWYGETYTVLATDANPDLYRRRRRAIVHNRP